MKALQCTFKLRRSAKVLGSLALIGVVLFLAQLSFPGCGNSVIEDFLVHIVSPWTNNISAQR